MLRVIVRFLIAVALAAGLGPLCWLVLEWAARGLAWPLPDTIATLGGAALGLLLALWRRPNWFFHTWLHEHAHLIVYVLLHWRTPTGLRVTDGRGGALEHFETDAVRATLVQIAPYTLPLLLLPVLALRHYGVVEPGPARQVMSALVGFLFLHHLQGLFYNVRINCTGDQADLVKVGRPLAFVLIVLALMLVTAWTLRVVMIGSPSGW
ncbi:MAG: hypothetical protein RMM29_07045 [Planctomycetota bacterium]|nr:hypothetical protein [Planctomycetota bacterium]MCX8039678.1 hypothetical protein [Planctomycetota bacterium]MDW8373386.1 hypothetical protein [Planctomycetota bacterium]